MRPWEIAAALGVSKRTVESDRYNLMQHSRVRSTIEQIRRAEDDGYFSS
jgi:DNA-binding NarL/FixJ family response regulator